MVVRSNFSMESITQTLMNAFAGTNFTLTDAYNAVPQKNPSSVRARIYENLNIDFTRIAKGVYSVMDDGETAILIEGDGRDLSFLKDGSVDCIITDHPWSDKNSNKGGNRNFTKYDTFRYEQSDFMDKARVLKDGSFLVEFLPAENANNFDYLYEVKRMAITAGFQYYAKSSWTKGTFIANTGRTAKNTEDIMIFTKGAPRSLRPDAKKNKQTGRNDNYMKGAAGMPPPTFNVQPPSRKERLHQSQKPVELLQRIMEYVTREGEVVLDQFTGSGTLLEAAVTSGRNAIGIEKDHHYVNVIKNHFKDHGLPLMVLERS
jgi:site-specific DNA-methyltransferase (adenine-specific)